MRVIEAVAGMSWYGHERPSNNTSVASVSWASAGGGTSVTSRGSFFGSTSFRLLGRSATFGRSRLAVADGMKHNRATTAPVRRVMGEPRWGWKDRCHAGNPRATSRLDLRTDRTHFGRTTFGLPVRVR